MLGFKPPFKSALPENSPECWYKFIYEFQLSSAVVVYNVLFPCSGSPLTLKWPRYFYSRWCPRGGSMEPPPEKTTFPPGFCNEICTIYVRDIKNHNSAKKKIKCCTVSKWRPNNRFLFRVISILAKFWKTTFPREFFNEIWLKEGEYK